MSVKTITVGGVTHQIDYNALENKPIIPPSPKEIKIINFTVDASKDDGRPKKDHAYADGKIDSIEIFRYACPERIDIDSEFKEGSKVDKIETHLSYWKDGVAIYARDGDFGYPEVNGTGQFNFRPNFNVSGYVLKPVVTDFNNVPHDKDTNPCYNNFKTPWLTGIEGVYRFTKICKDIKIDMQAVLESDLEAWPINYRIIAPAGYDNSKLPTVRVFRCSDQAEKYFKYYLHPEKYETLNPELMQGKLLEFTKLDTEEGEDQVWEVADISYDDGTGYPTKDGGKVTFLIDDSNIAENYTVSASKSGSVKNLNDGDFPNTKVLTQITGEGTVIIRVAPPVTVTYNDNGATEHEDPENPSSKVIYGFDAERTPSPVAQFSDFQFAIMHGRTFYKLAKTDPRRTDANKDLVYKDAECTELVAFADVIDLVAGITVGGTAITPTDVLSISRPDDIKPTKVVFTFAGSAVNGNVVISLATKSSEEPEEEQNSEQGE